MIPRDYITELVQRSDIVDVVQSYVQLRHRGRTHTGLCPFHNEKTPSFVVYPETQSFYCFGGGAGAGVKVDPVAFLIVKDGMTRVMPVAMPAATTVDRVLDLVPEVLDRMQNFVDKKREEKDIY